MILKNKSFELLKELRDICEKNKIQYFISGDLAACVYNDKEVEDDFHDASIMVFAKDVKKLISELEKIPNRIVESLKTNRKFPGFYIRYMDETTTLINYGDPTFQYKTNSLGINIEIICGKNINQKKDKIYSVLKHNWIHKNEAEFILKTKKKKKITRIKQRLVYLFFDVAGTKKMMSFLFDMWIKKGKKLNTNIEVALSNGLLVNTELSLFIDDKKYIIEGEAFNFVNDLKTFISCFELKERKRKYDICELSVPWGVFENVLKKQGISLHRIQKNQRKYSIWKKRKFNPMNKKRQTYYGYLFCSETRMKNHREYNEEKKRNISELYEKGEYNTVKYEMKEYLEQIDNYAKKNIGLSFDNKMLEIAIHMKIDDASKNSDDIQEFEAKCRKIMKIVDKVPVHHFDSIENIFWGERTKIDILEIRKKDIYDRLLHICESYAENNFRK